MDLELTHQEVQLIIVIINEKVSNGLRYDEAVLFGLEGLLTLFGAIKRWVNDEVETSPSCSLLKLLTQ
jgi:hypothetical protein